MGGAPPVAYTLAVWSAHSTVNALGGFTQFMIYIGNTSDVGVAGDPMVAFQLDSLDGSPNTVRVFSSYVGGPSAFLPVTDVWADGKPHLYVATVSITSSNLVATFYIDNVQVATATKTRSGSPSLFGQFATVVEVGGFVSPTKGSTSPAIPGGVYSHLALWNRALSVGEITDLWSAGKGYPNETSGARITRYLGYNWTKATAIDTGQSVMGVSTLADNTSILDACQGVTTAEAGNLWVEPINAGTVTFKARTVRYLTTVPKLTFGELENPYEDDIAYDYDPTLVFNDVQVTRDGGVTAVGGTAAARTSSVKSYGKRSYAVTINIASDQEAQDHADWVFAGHAQPSQRVATLTIKPSANPALWPVALGIRIGDRVTVKRRTSAFTMSSDFFIEHIEQRRVPGEWVFAFQMSPAGPFQPGIFDDATYGIFDQTFIFAF